MPNWFDRENRLAEILNNDYYRHKHHITSPRSAAHKYVQEARGHAPALETFSGEITVLELKHPPYPGSPTRFVRAFDTTRTNSAAGGWWVDFELFDRFRRASAAMSPADRAQAIKKFMRVRSAVSYDFNEMDGLAELNLPSGERTPALVGKAHYQRLIANPKHEKHGEVHNVFFMGGDLQYYVCIRHPSWIRLRSAAGSA